MYVCFRKAVNLINLPEHLDQWMEDEARCLNITGTGICFVAGNKKVLEQCFMNAKLAYL